MNRKRVEEGRLSSRGEGLGTVTREMVRKRAEEIAAIGGREPDNILSADLDQAFRELQGGETLHPQETAAERVPEGQRWDVPLGSPGHEAPTVPASDEQTLAEKLVDEGVREAEHDQAAQAAEERRKRESEDESK